MDQNKPVLTTYIISGTDFYIGLGLAVSSSLFIGSSFIIKKLALLRLSRYGLLRAGAGGYGYLKEWLWWAGFLAMSIGEFANFTAYAFAPASLVTPLGALSVLVGTFLASKFLNEKLNLLGKLGCFLCVLGSTVIVIHSPKEEEVDSMETLLLELQEPGFIIYVLLVVIFSTVIVVHIGPRYGHRNVCVYVALCSAIGSLTVMVSKGIGLGMKETISGKQNELGNWLTWMFLVLGFVFVSIQMNYLNKALDLFNTGIVTPVYYVMFTTLVIIASAILFKEWVHLSAEDILGNICGFLVIIIGIILLNTFKDMDVSLSDMKGVFHSKKDYLPHKMLLRDNDNISRSYGTPDSI